MWKGAGFENGAAGLAVKPMSADCSQMLQHMLTEMMMICFAGSHVQVHAMVSAPLQYPDLAPTPAGLLQIY